MNLYTTTQIVRLIGITPRQVHYWDKTNLIRPSLAGSGKGSLKHYSFINLVEFRAVKSMLDQGISVQAVRKTLDHLRSHYPELKSHLSEFKLITNGKDIFAIDIEGKGIKIPDGQLVLIIPFGDYYKDMQKLIKKNSIKPAITEIETLKFISDVDFWQSKPVIEYIDSEVNRRKNSRSLSLDDVRSIIGRSHKKKASA